MAKKKPHEILMLENAYGFDIHESKYGATEEGFIHTLFFDNLGISSLVPLSTLKEITFLSLFGNNITDLEPLKSLYKLTFLTISKNFVTDLGPLTELKGLYDFTANYNSITNLKVLAELPNIHSITLKNNQINDISSLSNMKIFENTHIDLRNNKIGKIPSSIPEIPIHFEVYENEKGLLLSGNPIIEPPIEIVEQGKAGIVKYWYEKARTGT